MRSHNLYENSPETIKLHLDGVAVGEAKAGIQLNDIKSATRQSKAGVGYSYSYTMHLPQGQTVLADGFVIAADRLYVLTYISADRGRLKDFEQFVGSFALKHDVHRR